MWSFTVCSERLSREAISLLVRPQQTSSISCCSRLLRSEPFLLCRFCWTANCWAAQRNSADEKHAGQTDSPAATARMAQTTSAADASRTMYPATPSRTACRKLSSLRERSPATERFCSGYGRSGADPQTGAGVDRTLRPVAQPRYSSEDHGTKAGEKNSANNWSMTMPRPFTRPHCTRSTASARLISIRQHSRESSAYSKPTRGTTIRKRSTAGLRTLALGSFTTARYACGRSIRDQWHPPAAVKAPVFGWIRNITTFPLSWFATSRRDPLGSISKFLGVLP